jgi:putative hydrolase of the HAD superfamily
MSFPKAILLDLDDTILASTESMERCWKKICEQFSPRLPDISPHQLFAAIQYSSARFWENPEQNARGRLNAALARQKIVRHALIVLRREEVDIANEIAHAFSTARRDGFANLKLTPFWAKR